MLFQKSFFNHFDPHLSGDTENIQKEQESNSFSGMRISGSQKVDGQTLIKFHQLYGNKWKQISNHLPNTSDSFIKNMFYTLARKALRKVNVYIEFDSKSKSRKPKIFKLNFVFKLANLAQSQRISDSKQNFDSLKGYYTKLLYNLLDVGKIQSEQMKELIHSHLSVEDDLRKSLDTLIENLRIIEKIFIQQNLIKKGRTKKKFPKKGLVQKAYSSKAFRITLEESQNYSFLSLSTTHSKQHKTDQIQFSQPEGYNMICELELPLDQLQAPKNDLDTCLEIKTFDPILFQ